MSDNNPTPGDDLVERLLSVADAAIRKDGSDIPLGELLREAAQALRTRDEAARSSTTGEVERAVRDVGSKTISLDAACEIAREALQAKDHSHAE